MTWIKSRLGLRKHTFLVDEIYFKFSMLFNLVFLLIFLAEDVEVEVFEPDPMPTAALHPVRRRRLVSH